MSASLVGSEMCIRDSRRVCSRAEARPRSATTVEASGSTRRGASSAFCSTCLLYTSDAADDM
eukprot:3970728-Alexandrium_andersonii.AAC.1